MLKCNDSKPLSNNERENLHSPVAKALSIAKRGMRDLLNAMSFLTTRVYGPNEGDYKKLK